MPPGPRGSKLRRLKWRKIHKISRTCSAGLLEREGKKAYLLYNVIFLDFDSIFL